MDRALWSRAGQVRRARSLRLGLVLAAGTLASSLLAQEGIDRSAELFREGRELLARGALQEACQKFDASLELRRSPGTLLNIGYCRAKTADLLAALEAYRGALALARQQQDREKARLWSTAAQKEIDALESRVAHLTVRVSQEDAVVQIDDGPVSAGGDAIPLNPGAHRVRASAPSKRTLELGVELSDGQRLTLSVPPLDDAAATRQAPTAGAAAPAAVSSSGPVSGRVGPSTLTSTPLGEASRGFAWRWPLLLGGGALFAGGAVCGVLAAEKVSEPDYGSRAQQDHARALALTADVLMGTGLVGVALGIAWPWIDPDPASATPATESSAREPRLTGLAGGCERDHCGLALSGVF